MVISSVEPDRNSYRLYIPFHFPSDSGSSYAVAVSTEFGKNVVSTYTLFIRLIIAETWAILIILGLRMSVRSLRDTDAYHPNPPSHNTAVISVGILNSNGLKDIAILAVSYLWKLRREATTRLKLVLWLVVVVIGLVADWGLPIVAAPHLALGQAAPANPDQIFSPNYSSPTSNIRSPSIQDQLANLKYELDLAYLTTPAALRAVGSAQVANASVRSQVYVGNKEPLQDPNGESFRINYHYNITGQDFGLQGLPGLQMNVEGSCQSSYQYFDRSYTVNNGATNKIELIDSYTITGRPPQNVSSALDGSRPIAYFYPIPAETTSTPTQYNLSYVLLFSTVGRTSFSQGTDPFYLTTNSTPNDPLFTVLPGRPVLTCWQADSIIYQGTAYSYLALESPTTIPYTISSILVNSLIDKIVKLGGILGPSALASAANSAVGPYFDAGTADVQADLSRLILTSYISNMNTFTDLTTFSSTNTSAIPNLIPPQNLTDASRFVLFSTAVTALSIPMLIAVPVVMIIWIGILFILKHCFQSHWFHVNAMRAPVLFRCLDDEMRKNTPEVQGVTHKFKQDENSCFEGNPIQQPVCIIPRHQGENLFWVKYLPGQQPSPLQEKVQVEVKDIQVSNA